jgi:hypothetical protein
MECMSVIRRAATKTTATATAAVPGYGPASLRSAYNLISASARDGRGATVGIVDAYRDPAAAADLARYRKHFGLPPCTLASGCLRIVNEHGRARPRPAANASWAAEESLDLDMVSAICPHCRILLAQASSNSATDLGIAEDTVVAMGARFVSDSWSSGEFDGQQRYDHYFNHPGVAITAASGDSGYGAAYPADTQFVTAVGGTTLTRSHASRGWSETAWAGSGSGCSAWEPKPSWQRADATAPDGCLNRTENDVAAVADPGTGVAIYDTYLSGGSWLEAGGTSVAAPIIAAVYALAGPPARGTYPAAYPYRHAGRFHRVTSGNNGTCEPNRQYLCHGQAGYNGPAGLGTPEGTGGFSSHGTSRVTLADPGTQDREAGTRFHLVIKGLDGRRSWRSVRFTARGLPPGLSVRRAPGSADGVITGTMPAAAGTFAATVTATDNITGQTGSARFTIVGVRSLTAAQRSFGTVVVRRDGTCLAGGSKAGARVLTRACVKSAAQRWAYVPDGRPGGPGKLTGNGLCLGLAAARGVLASCRPGAAAQAWRYLAPGHLQNPATRKCLSAAGATGTQVRLQACGNGPAESWTLPAGPVTSGIAGMCLAYAAASADPLVIRPCRNEAGEQFRFMANGAIRAVLPGSCLDAGGSMLDGSAVKVGSCDGSISQAWLIGPGGELTSMSSGKCLADPRDNATAGTGLVQEDCYGQPGEVWAAN